MKMPGNLFKNLMGSVGPKKAKTPPADAETEAMPLRPGDPIDPRDPEQRLKSSQRIPRLGKPGHIDRNKKPESSLIVQTPLPRRHGIAGLSERHKGEPLPRDSDTGVVQAKCNDTHYMARNEVVRYVQYHYAKYGEAVSSAVLAKILLPNGLSLMLQRLGLAQDGDPAKDHRRVLDYIERAGIETFCQKLNIRARPIVPAAPADPSPLEVAAAQADAQRSQATGESPRMGTDTRIRLQKLKMKPLEMGE